MGELRTDADGVIRVGATRVTLDTVVEAFREGTTVEEIVQQYPALRLADAYSALASYFENQSQLDAYLSARRIAAAQVREQNERRFDPRGVRERLLARRK